MLAVIGGTGIYSIEGLNIIEEHEVETPFGSPSAAIVRGEYLGKEILFLPRHGNNHGLLPSEVNYRANIWALKSLGVSQIIGLSAVGSLQQEVKPGDLAIADQYFDFVKSPREKTFFGAGLVAHVSTAEPTCCALADKINDAARAIDIDIHRNKTYACVDGPRLGTRAESLFLKNAVQADLVGMTNVPEVFLAREAQICYCTIGIATDYDCWQDDPAEHVTVEQVISRYGKSLEKAKSVLAAYIRGQAAECQTGCNHVLASSVLTPADAMDVQQSSLFKVLSA